MTTATFGLGENIGSVASQLLSYATKQGIHMFRPEDTNKNLTIINQDQSVITLVFSDSSGISSRDISKKLWKFSLVRRFYARWLTCP